MHPVDYAGPEFKYVVRYKAVTDDEWTEKTVSATKNEYKVVDNTVTFQEYEVQVVAENSVGRSTEEPKTVTGFSGESGKQNL